MGILIRFRGKRGQERKTCPECKLSLSLDAFWSDPYRSDGLFAYCKACAVTRRRKLRQEKREAMARIVAAGERCAAGAKAWDHHVAGLVTAWREMFEADTAMRTSRYDAGIDIDGGRIEIRLIHPRALYTLGLALQEASCPWPTPLIRTEQMLTTLAEYVGDAPQQDYVRDSNLQEPTDGSQEGNDAAERGQGPAEGSAEQGDSTGKGSHRTIRRRKRGPAADVAGRDLRE